MLEVFKSQLLQESEGCPYTLHEAPTQKYDLRGWSWCIWPNFHPQGVSGGIGHPLCHFGGVKNAKSALSGKVTFWLWAQIFSIQKWFIPANMVSIGSLHVKFCAGFEILENGPYRSEQRLIPSDLDTPSLTGRCIFLRMSSDLIFWLQVAEIWAYPPPEFGYWESNHLGEI